LPAKKRCPSRRTPLLPFLFLLPVAWGVASYQYTMCASRATNCPSFFFLSFYSSPSFREQGREKKRKDRGRQVQRLFPFFPLFFPFSSLFFTVYCPLLCSRRLIDWIFFLPFLLSPPPPPLSPSPASLSLRVDQQETGNVEVDIQARTRLRLLLPSPLFSFPSFL